MKNLWTISLLTISVLANADGTADYMKSDCGISENEISDVIANRINGLTGTKSTVSIVIDGDYVVAEIASAWRRGNKYPYSSDFVKCQVFKHWAEVEISKCSWYTAGSPYPARHPGEDIYLGGVPYEKQFNDRPLIGNWDSLWALGEIAGREVMDNYASRIGALPIHISGCRSKPVIDKNFEKALSIKRQLNL